MDGNRLAGNGSHAPGRWSRFAMRGVMVAGCAVVIAVCLWAMFRDEFATSLVYSLCIGLMCWLFIDLGRHLVPSPTGVRSFAATPALGSWPGWTRVIGIIAVGATLGYASGNEVANWLTGLASPGPFNADLGELKSVLVLTFVPAIVITYYMISREVIAAQRVEVEMAQRQAAEQQLKLLESQLEPHMLFNTLANLRALIAVDPARAQAMLDQLIAFLRASLDGSRAALHPLAAEFGRLRGYLALMQVRMGPRLETRFELPPALAGAMVPPLLLQPLVENSIKHGLEPCIGGGRIEVSAARDGDTLVLQVRNSGAGFDADAAGDGRYGLAHVRERLATLYGGRASFAIAAVDEGGALATLRLPLTPPADTAMRPS